MQRYFALNIDDNQIYLDSGDVFHLTKVMRANIGTRLIAIKDKPYLGEIISLNPFIIKNLGVNEEMNRELDVDVTLFFALAKGDKIDFVIQKATELGVKNIVLIKTEHCVVKMSEEDLKRKISLRYQKIMKEAAEQSERLIIPNLLGVYDIKHIPTNLLADINLVCYERCDDTSIHIPLEKNTKSISVLIGPEGGLTKDEVNHLLNNKFQILSLGKTILRTETAAVAALSMIGMVINNENNI